MTQFFTPQATAPEDDPVAGVELEQARWVWTPADVAGVIFAVTLCIAFLIVVAALAL